MVLCRFVLRRRERPVWCVSWLTGLDVMARGRALTSGAWIRRGGGGKTTAGVCAFRIRQQHSSPPAATHVPHVIALFTITVTAHSSPVDTEQHSHHKHSHHRSRSRQAPSASPKHVSRRPSLFPVLLPRLADMQAAQSWILRRQPRPQARSVSYVGRGRGAGQGLQRRQAQEVRLRVRGPRVARTRRRAVHGVHPDADSDVSGKLEPYRCHFHSHCFVVVGRLRRARRVAGRPSRHGALAPRPSSSRGAGIHLFAEHAPPLGSVHGRQRPE